MPSADEPSKAQFDALIQKITSYIGQRALNDELEADLNETYPPLGTDARQLVASCQSAIAEGWMCTREAGGIRFGRVVKPEPATLGFSVDVVDMQPLAGPHHRHPHGEIDFIMPLDESARFDGRPAGWLVYGPGSAHAPTVTGGRALVLYLLPHGAIEFTRG